MLTSSANQYLRPEYLTPLPTTLDAKKSPLALLAQTCSQIGNDAPNNKLIQSAEKASKTSSSKSEASREKSSPASSLSNNSASDVSVKSSFKPYDTALAASAARDKTKSPEEKSASNSSSSSSKTPASNKSAGNRCGSNQSATSPAGSPVIGSKTPASEAKASEASTSSSTATTTTKTAGPQDAPTKELAGLYKPGQPSIPVSSAFLGGYPMPLPMDLMASSLMSQHHALKANALNPYLGYARMKSPTGGDTLVPVCRDPYCTGCSLSSHLLATSNGKAAGACPAGCAQCDHAAKTPGYLGHSPAAAAYAHAQLAALAAASQMPYVCSWIGSDASYCGKRFSSSEELLQHLRTHTSLSSVSESSAALSMLTPPGMPPTHPLLHRTYPTPPLSPLATARYHPYSKPSSLLPPSLAASSLAAGLSFSHPSLPPYFSPYSLYGPRLGAASTMHP